MNDKLILDQILSGTDLEATFAILSRADIDRLTSTLDDLASRAGRASVYLTARSANLSQDQAERRTGMANRQIRRALGYTTP